MTTEKALPLVEQLIKLTHQAKINWHTIDGYSIAERLPGYPIQGLVYRAEAKAGAVVLYRYLGRWYRDEDEFFMLPYERLELLTKDGQVADYIDSVPVPVLNELYTAVVAASPEVKQLYDQWMHVS